MPFFVKWHTIAISLCVYFMCKICNLQTENVDKVQHETKSKEQFQEHIFQGRYHKFLSAVPLDRLLWQTDGGWTRYLKSRGYSKIALAKNTLHSTRSKWPICTSLWNVYNIICGTIVSCKLGHWIDWMNHPLGERIWWVEIARMIIYTHLAAEIPPKPVIIMSINNH